jgi:hypothetical protein
VRRKKRPRLLQRGRAGIDADHNAARTDDARQRRLMRCEIDEASQLRIGGTEGVAVLYRTTDTPVPSPSGRMIVSSRSSLAMR